MSGLRSSYLSREAYRLRAQGSTLEQILLRLRAYNESRCDPPLPDEEIIQIAHERIDIEPETTSCRPVGPVGLAHAHAAEPQDLRAPQESITSSYPLAALGPILGAAARRIHQVAQAPAALCGQAVLAAASLAAQAHADVEMDGRRELLCVYALSVGELAERKRHVDHIALTAHREHERATLEQRQQDMLTYRIAREAHGAARRQACRGRDPATIRCALEALGPPPSPPCTAIFLAPAASHDALTRLYAGGQASVGLFHDDARGLHGAPGAADAARIKGAASLARLWDAGEIDAGEAKYFGRRLALHLMLTPELASRVLASEAVMRSGLLARTLPVWLASPAGERPYVEGDLTVDPALVRYHERIRTLLTQAAPGGSELAPGTLTLDAAARQAWIAAHDALEAGQADEGALARVRAWADKAPAHILRIAGVLTLVEDPQARIIRAGAIEQASVLAQHHVDEAARLAAHTSVPVEVRHAEALRDWCHRQGIRQLHSAEALQFGPHSLRTATLFDAAIQVLERKGWALRIPGGCVIDGKRRRRAWSIAGPRQDTA
jgi:hypothetical protein